MKTPIKPWKYRHFKWRMYEVIYTGTDSETLEEVIIYKALYNSPEFWNNAIWVRRRSEFEEKVLVEWKEISRFVLIEES